MIRRIVRGAGAQRAARSGVVARRSYAAAAAGLPPAQPSEWVDTYPVRPARKLLCAPTARLD